MKSLTQRLTESVLNESSFKRGNDVRITLPTGVVKVGKYVDSYRNGEMHTVTCDGKDYGVSTENIQKLKKISYSKLISIENEIDNLNLEYKSLEREMENDPEVAMTNDKISYARYGKRMEYITKRINKLKSQIYSS